MNTRLKPSAYSCVEITIPISPGELLDRLVILEIKSERIMDPAKRANVVAEWSALALIEERAPDVDVDVFQTQIRRIGPQRPRFSLFVSQDDRALALSIEVTATRLISSSILSLGISQGRSPIWL